MTDRKYYNIGAVKIPHADRDIAHDILGERPGERWSDIIGSDTADNDERFPIGSNTTYRVLLNDDEVQRFKSASNCRYVSEDIEIKNASCGPTTCPNWRTWNWIGDWPASTSLNGIGVKIAVCDGGTTAAMRAYKNITLAGRTTTASPAQTGEIDGFNHGCLCAGTAVPYSGTLLDAQVISATDSTNDSSVASGITWACTNGAQVINLSLTFMNNPGPATHDALIAAGTASGAPAIFFAMGNDSTNYIPYPAVYGATIPLSYVYTVGGYDMSTGYMWTGSNWDTRGTGVAPSIMVRTISDPVTDPGYETEWYGTSAASPQIAQCCARLVSGGVTPRQAGAALKATTVDMGQSPYQCGGRFNFKAAAEYLGISPPAAVTVDPVVFQSQKWPGVL